VSGPSGPPGWYPAEPGFVRWWDGQRWGPPRPGDGAHLPPGDGGVSPPVESPLTARPSVPLPGARPGDNTKTLVTLAHLGFVLGAFIMPLAVYLVEKERPFVRHHAAGALNFQLTVLLVCVLSVPLMLVFVGFFTLLAAVVADVVLCLVGVREANRGRWWRYPVNIRFVRP